MTPLLTILTPTYRRPQALAACLQSIGAQTLRDQIEHLVFPDYVGLGIADTYRRLAEYGGAIHGRYVAYVGDDDVLLGPDSVAAIAAVIKAAGDPPLVLAPVRKGPLWLPGAWPPLCRQIDLGNLILRADLWRTHAHAFGPRYEGDFDLADALYRAGWVPIRSAVAWLEGPIGRGLVEGAA